MTTTLEDAMYDDYWIDMHDNYVLALEEFASSTNLGELKSNLDKLNSVVKENQEVGNPKTETFLRELATLNIVYEEILSSKQTGKRQFIAGSMLAAIGIILSGISLL